MNNDHELNGAFITINGHTLFHYQAGSGPALVMIHGHRSDVLRFESIVQFFADYFHVYAPDLPGFGKSPPLSERHTMDEYGAIIHQYIKKLELENLYIVGASMGGIIAFHTLKSRDLSVEQLILLSTPASGEVFLYSKPRIMIITTIFTLLLHFRLARGLLQRCINSDFLMKKAMRLALPRQFRDPEIIQFEMEQWRVMPIHIWLETILEIINTNLLEENVQINVPTIVVYADRDHYFDNEKNLTQLHQIFPNMKAIATSSDRHVPPGRLSYERVREMGEPILEEIGITK